MVDRLSPRNSSGKKVFTGPNITPTLYAIPESTPLPDSPSSFPPASPYIINHKRRGPRLIKNLPRNDAGGSCAVVEKKAEASFESCVKNVVDGVSGAETDCRKCGTSNGGQTGPDSDAVNFPEEKLNGHHVNVELIGPEDLVQSCYSERDMEIDDFFDPQDTLSASSNNGSMRWRPGTPSGEYFDAFEEISSDGTSRSFYRNTEDELHEMRTNFLMEVERCKQAEEEIENLQTQWKTLSHHLSLVGLSLPAPPIFTGEAEEEPSIDPAEELCQQIVVSRFVADTLGKVSSCIEAEMEIQPLIESKNFEITRLQDRVQYYEAANREMSQRNQEAVELARQQRCKRKRRQKWFWCSIGLVVTLGVAAIAWPYLPPASTSTTNEADATENHNK